MNFANVFGVSKLNLIFEGFQSYSRKNDQFFTILETNSFITFNLPEAAQNHKEENKIALNDKDYSIMRKENFVHGISYCTMNTFLKTSK